MGVNWHYPTIIPVANRSTVEGTVDSSIEISSAFSAGSRRLSRRRGTTSSIEEPSKDVDSTHAALPETGEIAGDR